MSVVHTLAKRAADPEAHFKAVLDQLAADPAKTLLACCSTPVEPYPDVHAGAAAAPVRSTSSPSLRLRDYNGRF